MNWKKTIASSVLALAIAVPAAGSMAASETSEGGTVEPAPPVNQQGNWQDGRFGDMKARFGEMKDRFQDRKEQRGEHHKHGLQAGIHQQTYLTLLSDQYTPDQTDEWEAAFDTRSELMEQMKALKDAKSEEMKAEMEAIKEKLQNGEITKEELRALMQEKKDRINPEAKDAIKAHHENMHALMKQLGEALDADNAETIQSTLNELLAQLQQGNTWLAEKLQHAADAENA
ncbi:hypothetical protein [Marinicrinis sediminis]|uniref:Uncharacterized protein n=1 Tax=Marinicrinis sediminis TaxID=1652465 RepID=A0ABW5R7A0_9BACL